MSVVNESTTYLRGLEVAELKEEDIILKPSINYTIIHRPKCITKSNRKICFIICCDLCFL